LIRRAALVGLQQMVALGVMQREHGVKRIFKLEMG
jgi:hypothetical protein